jgi:hypothetical protein
VDGAVHREVEAGWGEVAPRRDGGVEALLDDVARRRVDAGWDVVVCLTDLPLQRERVPLVAHSSVRRRALSYRVEFRVHARHPVSMPGPLGISTLGSHRPQQE